MYKRQVVLVVVSMTPITGRVLDVVVMVPMTPITERALVVVVIYVYPRIRPCGPRVAWILRGRKKWSILPVLENMVRPNATNARRKAVADRVVEARYSNVHGPNLGATTLHMHEPAATVQRCNLGATTLHMHEPAATVQLCALVCLALLLLQKNR